jgi:acetyl-CoA carboxylase biotin carboxyl carrier protein
VQLDLEQLRELLAAINQTDISELILKSGDLELTVRKGSHRVEPMPSVAELPSVVAPAVSAEAFNRNPVASGSNAGVSPPPAPPTSVVPTPDNKKWVDVTSPMVGTFYRSPAPSEPAFVEVGDRISLGQTLCIIEAMKLMNEIEAEVSGQVMEIVAQNGEPVEYGQVLMRINPD